MASRNCISISILICYGMSLLAVLLHTLLDSKCWCMQFRGSGEFFNNLDCVCGGGMCVFVYVCVCVWGGGGHISPLVRCQSSVPHGYPTAGPKPLAHGGR
jgi:hypothetical protein